MIRFERPRRGALLQIAAAILAPCFAHAVPAAGNSAERPSPPATGGEPAAPIANPRPNPAAASATPGAPPASLPNLEPLAAGDCTGILGKKVMGPDCKQLGLLTDILVDVEGRPHAAIIDFGGFLGAGSRKIAVDWRLLTLTPEQSGSKISVNRINSRRDR